MNNLYKSLSLLLTLCLAAAAFAGLTLQAAAADTTANIVFNGSDPAKLNGVNVAAGTINVDPDNIGVTTVNISGSTTIKYTVKCGTDVTSIKLNDATWTAPDGSPALMITGSDVTIEVVGNDNALTGGGGIGDDGIFSIGNIKITGSGSVKATGGIGGNNGGDGICAGIVEIKGSGNVTATGGDGISDGGSGILAGISVTIEGSGSVKATGGKGGVIGGNGIFAMSITISGSGNVTAEGGNGSGGGGDGISAGGDVKITGSGSVTAEGGIGIYAGGSVTISGSGNVTAEGGGGYGGHGAWINGNLNVYITAGTVTFTGGTGSAMRGHGVVDIDRNAWTTEDKINHPGVNMSPIAGNKGDAKPGELKFWVDSAEQKPAERTTTTTRSRAATELSLSLKRNFDETTLTPKIRYDFTIVGPENWDTAYVYVKGGTLTSRSGLNFTVIPDAEAEIVEITISANGYKQLTIEYDIAAARQNSEPMPDDDGDNFNPGTGV